ncbi:MAG: C-type lectin domain-containing protein [Phycisphaerae bacterium]
MFRPPAILLSALACTLAGCAQQPSGLPAEASAFQGHHYQVFEMDLTWHEAKAHCEKLGGHLAVIETEAEQLFIVDLADGRYLYLGATDEAEEGTWVWINGAQWDYTDWMSGQPNNYGGDEHYLATYDDGYWVDVAAEGSGFWMPIGFICEWDR